MNQPNQAGSNNIGHTIGHIGWSPDYKPMDYKPVLCQLLWELDGKTEMLDKVMDEIRHYRSIRFLVFREWIQPTATSELVAIYGTKEAAENWVKEVMSDCSDRVSVRHRILDLRKTGLWDGYTGDLV